MSIHSIQDNLVLAWMMWPYLTALLFSGAIACFVFRRSRWIVPIWIFLLFPALLLVISQMFYLTKLLHAIGAGTFPGFTLSESILGIALLLAFPRDRTWERHSILASIITGVISMVAVIFFLMSSPPNI